MMNGLEKSDLAIVAGKPANKGARALAEWAEPRAGTKGNTDQARTRRTQSRCSVSPGLGRVRQAAKAAKGRRFTALLHHVDVALLECPDGHFKLPHLWPVKLPRAGRPNYGSVARLSAMREAASLSR